MALSSSQEVLSSDSEGREMLCHLVSSASFEPGGSDRVNHICSQGLAPRELSVSSPLGSLSS